MAGVGIGVGVGAGVGVSGDPVHSVLFVFHYSGLI